VENAAVREAGSLFKIVFQGIRKNPVLYSFLVNTLSSLKVWRIRKWKMVAQLQHNNEHVIKHVRIP
jgi:hypothetical protein